MTGDRIEEIPAGQELRIISAEGRSLIRLLKVSRGTDLF